MTFTEARALAAAHINEGIKRPEGYTPIIVDSNTQELSWGWIFFYNSKEYVDTHDILYALAGNAPVVVTHDGSVHETGTARPLEEYLKDIQTRVEV
jgi:immunity protein 35 of polymorphic toxin system